MEGRKEADGMMGAADLLSGLSGCLFEKSVFSQWLKDVKDVISCCCCKRANHTKKLVLGREKMSKIE
jgi:hypothetical protein